MGRKPSTNLNLPKGMRARVRRRKYGEDVTYYFYDAGRVDGKRKEIPLGSDYVLAVQEWAKLEVAKIPKHGEVTFLYVGQRYLNEVLPTKAAGTQSQDRIRYRRLSAFFGNPDAPLSVITPQHIRQYLDWRKSTPGSANNEVALFSAIWNKAREWGYTTLQNPCQGVKKYPVRRRDVYIEDRIYKLVYDAADAQMKDMMDLAYITGQRPIDVVKIHTAHIHDGVLDITQQKTKAKLRFEVTGLLKEIVERRSPPDGGYLFRSSRGGRLARATLTKQFSKLRQSLVKQHPALEDELMQFQFRDLRAKSGTDAYLQSDSMDTAQKQLGHASPQMTKVYIRKEKPLKPLK